jgi:2-aminoadipate transaminase
MNVTFSDRISALQPSAIREILKSASDPNVISLAAGNPAPESFPVEDIKRLSAEIFEQNPVESLQYGISEGYTLLRNALKEHMRTHFDCGSNIDDLIIVSGAQQGIELACKILCNEGDTVICENPSFIGALNAFRSYNVNLYGVEIEQDGINLQALEVALKMQKNVKLIYVIPTFQNPTGITMSEAKRKAVYELAKKYNVMILEDNPYADLRFEGENVPCIKTLDTDGLVIYCGSFSKILSAGIRVGYVLAPTTVIQKIVVAKQVSDVHTNMFFQILAYRFITECNLEQHIKKIQQIYKHKSSLMINGIEQHFRKDITFIRPQGGLFLWCNLPQSINMIDFCKLAAANGVAVVPGSAFNVNASDYCNSIRLNYSTPTDDQIVKGMEILGSLDFKV